MVLNQETEYHSFLPCTEQPRTENKSCLPHSQFSLLGMALGVIRTGILSLHLFSNLLTPSFCLFFEIKNVRLSKDKLWPRATKLVKK